MINSVSLLCVLILFIIGRSSQRAHCALDNKVPVAVKRHRQNMPRFIMWNLFVMFFEMKHLKIVAGANALLLFVDIWCDSTLEI